MRRLALALDRRGSVDDLKRRELRERDAVAVGGGHQDLAEMLDVEPIAVVDANGDRDPSIRFLHRADLEPAERTHDLQHVAGRDPVARDRVTIDDDLEHRLPRDLLHGDVGRAKIFFSSASMSRAFSFNSSRSSPKSLTPTSLRIPRDHFVYAHLDRLHERGAHRVGLPRPAASPRRARPASSPSSSARGA